MVKGLRSAHRLAQRRDDIASHGEGPDQPGLQALGFVFMLYGLCIGLRGSKALTAWRSGGMTLPATARDPISQK